jgi:sodium-dependent phosphate transporter
MLAFTCALAASATWLMIATKNSWPVSTTYSIVSALAGVGVAVAGPSGVQWGWNGGKGLATIFAGFGIAPAVSAGFASVIYLITKFAVLDRKNSAKKAIYLAPFYFFTVFAVLTMSIVYKGSPSLNLDELPEVTIALAIVLTALVGAILSIILWAPYVYVKCVKKDYTLKWWHFVYGPLLLKRPTPELPADGAISTVTDYRVVRDEPAQETAPPTDLEKATEAEEHVCTCRDPTPEVPLAEVERDDKIIGNWVKPRNLLILAKRAWGKITHGSKIDIHETQKQSGEAEKLREIHEIAKQYDNDTEHMYTYLQVLTACVNSFAHGANDVSNAIGPFAAIYYVWSTGENLGKNTPTPTWILVFGAVFIVIGLATYGYNIMAAMGNRLTLHSPSRGFSMQFGAAITVLLASQYGIPVSSTMCLAGATAGVGLCSGGPKAVNWRAFGWIVLGWVLTVPVAGTAAGCLMGLFINAPHW